MPTGHKTGKGDAMKGWKVVVVAVSAVAVICCAAIGVIVALKKAGKGAK